jgi:hypothetical protein
LEFLIRKEISIRHNDGIVSSPDNLMTKPGLFLFILHDFLGSWFEVLEGSMVKGEKW